MTAIVWTDVTTFPGASSALTGVDAAWQTVFLQLANTYLDPTIFDGEAGPATKTARVLYVQHLYAMDVLAGRMTVTGASGPVTKNESDKLRQEYGSLDRSGGGALNSDPLSQTMYGRALLTLAWSRTRAMVLR